jgi:hypothetical protein
MHALTAGKEKKISAFAEESSMFYRLQYLQEFGNTRIVQKKTAGLKS